MPNLKGVNVQRATYQGRHFLSINTNCKILLLPGPDDTQIHPSVKGQPGGLDICLPHNSGFNHLNVDTSDGLEEWHTPFTCKIYVLSRRSYWLYYIYYRLPYLENKYFVCIEEGTYNMSMSSKRHLVLLLWKKKKTCLNLQHKYGYGDKGLGPERVRHHCSSRLTN